MSTIYSKLPKQMVFLGRPDGMSIEEFQNWYLSDHAKKIAAREDIDQYYANKIVEPTKEMLDAGWGFYPNEDHTEILAVDEIWAPEGYDVLALYEGENVKIMCAYDGIEVSYKPCLAKWEVGEKSHFLKRMSLLKCLDGQRQIDFFNYWEKGHAPPALRTHTGAAMYNQELYFKTLVPGETAWDGMCILDYWNVDSFQFGHFSRPTAQAEITEDCQKFLDAIRPLTAEEYVMKRDPEYINKIFANYKVVIV